jgi:cysteine desulfurase
MLPAGIIPLAGRPKKRLTRAREQVAGLVGAEENEIIFTSGATEADNLAMKGVFETYAVKGSHIITCNIEHKAVLDVCKALEKRGAEVTYLPVNNEGLVTPEQVEAAIRPDTILVAIMYANNELGTVMPVQEIGAVARRHGVLFFTDATQAVGKIPVDVNRDNIDLLALSAHKLYGPKGRVPCMCAGGTQGKTSGTTARRRPRTRHAERYAECTGYCGAWESL